MHAVVLFYLIMVLPCLVSVAWRHRLAAVRVVMWKLSAALTLGVGAASVASGVVLSLSHLINRDGQSYSQGIIDLAVGCGLCVFVGVLSRMLLAQPDSTPAGKQNVAAGTMDDQ